MMDSNEIAYKVLESAYWDGNSKEADNVLLTALQALEFRIPKKVRQKVVLSCGIAKKIWVCPECEKPISLQHTPCFCENCGQKLEWEGKDKNV